MSKYRFEYLFLWLKPGYKYGSAVRKNNKHLIQRKSTVGFKP